MKTLTVLALSIVTAISGVAPANAFPIAPQVAFQTTSRATDVQRVQFPYERGEARKSRPGCGLPYCGRGRGYYRDRDRRYRDGYYRDGYYRDRYRRYYRDDDNDVGAFIGGLAAGAIVGGLLSQPRYYNQPRVVGGSAHTRWCYARYRSYRAWDNSYQPYSGSRRQCYSPY
ncbi:BA14K family protein [Ensifer sp. MJa1]|uniref:BA14K family protein n=1 Tax=Ensifer sp. MJa1 TaxID=2919888 RepID=UPI003008C9B9